MVAVPPGCSMRKHCSTVAGMPMHSKEYSTPPCVISITRAATSPSLARRTSVAPNFRASSSLRGTLSIAMMREAPAIAAPLMVAKPTPPQPTTATSAPAGTWALLKTAPVPVITAQPSKAARSSGMSLRILTRALRCTSICSAKPERLNTWLTCWPSRASRCALPGGCLTSVSMHRGESAAQALLTGAAKHGERTDHVVAGLQVLHARAHDLHDRRRPHGPAHRAGGTCTCPG